MSSALIVKNKFDGNDYRVSGAPVRKRASVPNPMERAFSELAPKKLASELGRSLGRLDFNNIIFEAAIFTQKKIFKPLFIIALDDGYSEPMTEEEFTTFVHNIIANEKIEDLRNGENKIYNNYGFVATEHDVWQLLLLSKMRIVFVFEDPEKKSNMLHSF